METSGGIQASLSGRYATALFELARDTRTIDTVESSLANVRAALAQSEEFARLVNQTITDRTRFIWFPFIEIERYADKSYSDES